MYKKEEEDEVIKGDVRRVRKHKIESMGIFHTIAKATSKRVARHVTKQTIKTLAVRGAKELAKGATLAGVGYGTEYAISRAQGGAGGKRKHRRRKTIKGSSR